jgi:hypothetical protein
LAAATIAARDPARRQSRYSLRMPASLFSSASSRLLALVALLVFTGTATAQEPSSAAAYLAYLQDQFFLQPIDEPIRSEVRYHLVPLGAVQKVRGKWAPRESERVTGTREAHTWRITEGFTVDDVVADLDARLEDDPDAEIRFRCGGISCGSSVQWANSVFDERLLYGTQDSQRCRVWALTEDGNEYRLLIYGAARTVDRQYLRVELLSVDEVR